MNSTNIISLLALIVSLISFWLSYRTTRKSNFVIVAEKRYEAYNTCIETFMHLQVLYSNLMKLQEKVRSIPALADRSAKISQHLYENIEAHKYLLQEVEKLSERIKASSINDPVFFEQAKSVTKELSLRTKQITSNIENIETQANELFQILNEPTKSSILLPD